MTEHSPDLAAESATAVATVTPSRPDETASIDRLMADCVLVDYSVGWLPMARKLRTDQKHDMVTVVGAADDAMSVGKRLFTCGHATLKELNRARTAIDAFRTGWTIPMAAEVGRRLDAEAVPNQEESSSTRVAPGIRLLLRKDVETFESLFNGLKRKLADAASAVQAKMPEIRDLEKKRLGQAFNADDYPDDVVKSVRIVGPTYSEFTVSTRLPKHIYDRQVAEIRTRLESSVVLATDNIVGELIMAFDSLANQLGCRRRVGDIPQSTYDQYAECDIAYERSMAGGVCQVGIRTGGTDGTETTERLTFATRAEMESALSPVIIDGTANLRTDAIDKISVWMDNFERVKTMLGDSGRAIAGNLETLQKTLAGLHARKTSLPSLLKRDRTARTGLSEALRSAIDAIAETAETTREVRTTRRMSM